MRIYGDIMLDMKLNMNYLFELGTNDGSITEENLDGAMSGMEEGINRPGSTIRAHVSRYQPGRMLKLANLVLDIFPDIKEKFEKEDWDNIEDILRTIESETKP